ncbi:hypothetical protein Tco_1302743 [Tanacetum coccineum]
MLITKICPLLATRTTVDDDEIAPRRNAFLSFKVPDKNLLTTRTMDDEDAPGLKAVLTFQVPDEVAHEDVDDKDEQCSPVSVMDFPSDNDTSMDDEDDDSSTFHNRHVHVEERKLMHKTRRFESVPQLEPVRFDDRIAQSESSTQTCLEHAQEHDQVEKNAMTLLQLTKLTVSSHHFMKHESVESLLLAFFKEKMINEHVSDSEMLHVAKDWMDEQKMFLDWGCEDDKITCIREMEKTFRWSKYGDELEKENLVSELEDEIFSSLVDDILLDFQMTTVDDDEIAPRRNAVLSFKVLDKNMLTTRTMDDEDAPGLKATSYLHVCWTGLAQSEALNKKCLELCPEDVQVEFLQRENYHTILVLYFWKCYMCERWMDEQKMFPDWGCGDDKLTEVRGVGEDNKCVKDKDEQGSPVSVMDFPSDNDTSMDDEDDDSSTFHNRHVHVEGEKIGGLSQKMFPDWGCGR